MQTVLGKASEAVAAAMESNTKTTDMKPEIREPSSSVPLTSDFKVKNTNHDI
jgi:catalase